MWDNLHTTHHSSLHIGKPTARLPFERACRCSTRIMQQNVEQTKCKIRPFTFTINFCTSTVPWREQTSPYTCSCFIQRFIRADSTTCINSVYFTSAQPRPNLPSRGERIIGITKGNINIHNGKSFRNAFYNHYTLKWNWAKPKLSSFRSWMLKDIIPYLCYYHTSHDQDVCSQPE